MEDNKRIISVQIANANQAEVYYADSPDPTSNLETAKSKLEQFVAKGYVFSGFNIKRFDILLLSHFWNVHFPEASVFDLVSHNGVVGLRQYGIYGLENVCAQYGISVTHKQKMNKRVQSNKVQTDIIAQAKAAASLIVKEKGGTLEFAFDEAIQKISMGRAIYDSYVEFIKNGHRRDSLFYEYAIGDVICERQLLDVLMKK